MNSRAEEAVVQPRPIADLLFLVCTISLGEIAYWTYTKEVSHYRVIGWEFAWMIPAGYAMVAAVVSLAALAARRLNGKWPSAFVVTALVAAGLSGLLRLKFNSLHPIAALILGLGVGIQAARLATGRPALWRRLV